MDTLIRLILRARTGDRAACNALVIRYQDMAVGYAYSILRDFHLAQDAAQEAFVAAFRDLSSLRAPESFPAWFKTIVFKHCDRITRRGPHKLVPVDEDALTSEDLDPLSRLEKEESAQQVLAAIDSLPEEEREAVTLFYMGEYTHADISSFLGLPEATVNNRLRSARKRLKKGLISMAKEAMNRQAPSRDTQFAHRTAKMLEDAWSLRGEGNYDEGRKILKEVEELCSDNDDQTWGRIYAVYAQYDRDNGNLESALELSERSLKHYEKATNQGSIAHTIRHIADIQDGLGRHAEAEKNYQKALKLYRGSSETTAHDLANALRPYGRLLKKLGRIDEARELLLEANKKYKEAGNQPGIDGTQAMLNELADP